MPPIAGGETSCPLSKRKGVTHMSITLSDLISILGLIFTALGFGFRLGLRAGKPRNKK